MVVRMAGVVLAVAVFSGLFARPALAAEEAAPCFSADGSHEVNQEILEALRKPLPRGGLEFHETPLEEIIAMLRDQYEIEIVIDRKSFEDLGMDATQPITMQLQNISLQSALRLMLTELELTYIVDNEVLLITTQEAADTRLVIYVYPVRDLIDPSYRPTEAEKKKGGPAELIPITESLIATVASDTWAANKAGEAEIKPLRPGVLVISQTQAVHEEIRNALAAIRRAKQFALQTQAVPEGMSAMGMEGGYGGMGMMGEGEFGEMEGGMRGGRGGFMGEAGMERGGFGEEGGFGGRGGFEGGGFGGFGSPPKEKTKAKDDPF